MLVILVVYIPKATKRREINTKCLFPQEFQKQIVYFSSFCKLHFAFLPHNYLRMSKKSSIFAP